MQKTKVDIKERTHGAIIEITTVNGKEFRIAVHDDFDSIEITTTEGSIRIKPCVVNQIRLYSED